MFSAGLDVVALQPLGRDAMRLFWQRFASLFMRLYTTSKISVACIEGHAPAGGCVLAIACDYRVMANGPYKIGLNEVAVGLAVPGWLTEVYVDLIGRRHAERALQLGEMMSPQRAHAIGLVDEVVPLALAMDKACAELSLRLKSPPLARGLTKTALRAAVAERLNQRQQAELEPLLDVWFADECRSVMAALVARLKG
ncbi:MAG TPA: enoyl-CoA hydratase/isomerase family protein, partial [Myxococcales bacterium]|nr:enoyl-CoA hydratase/isomerase family protein [Myxococcales bacterium]